ncbi:hypothetical protein BCV70DRAFT_139834, partial [Testicularia cyperi]
STAELTSPPPPTKKAKLSPHQVQAQAISKLLANPDKEIKISSASSAGKSIRPPRDMMKNVSGSSAGAGSGEFHVYKQQRRREYERIQIMEEQAQQAAEKDEFDRKRAAQQQHDEAKTDKNRAKREKKKLAALKARAVVKGKDPARVSSSLRPQDTLTAASQTLHNNDVQRVQFKRKADEDEQDSSAQE